MAKIGIEIEFTGSPEAVMREVRNAGLSIRTLRYSEEIPPGTWAMKSDASVRGGGELVSPPLEFTDPAERGQITLAVLALQRAGARPDSSAGIHVHVDGRDLTYKQVAATARFFYKFQDVLYRIAGSGWRGIRSTSDDGYNYEDYRYCKPLDLDRAKKFYKVTDERSFSSAWFGNINEIFAARGQHHHNSRYCGLNLQSWVYRGTVEFRIFNSSVNPERVQAFVALAHGVVADARNGFSRSIGKSYTLGSMATADNPEAAAKTAFLRFQQVMTTDSTDTKRVVSADDWKLIRKAWNDSTPQGRGWNTSVDQYGRAGRQLVGV